MPRKKFDPSSSSKEGTEYSEEAYWENDPETVRRFLENLPAYEQLSSEVAFTIKEILKARTIEVASVLHRTKELKSFLEKIHRKTYEDPFREIKDFSGVRVVCYYTDDLREVSKIIRDQFQVLEKDDKTAASATDRFGYGGIHFIVKLGNELSGPRYDRLKELPCEIQLRTVMQDAWATVSHHLLYKQEADVPDVLKRRVNALAGALDSADIAFHAIQSEKVKYLSSVQASISADDLNEILIDIDSLTAYLNNKFSNKTLSFKKDYSVNISNLKDLLASQNIVNLRQLETLIDETYSAKQDLQENLKHLRHRDRFDAINEAYQSLGISNPNLVAKQLVDRQVLEAYEKAHNIYLRHRN